MLSRGLQNAGKVTGALQQMHRSISDTVPGRLEQRQHLTDPSRRPNVPAAKLEALTQRQSLL